MSSPIASLLAQHTDNPSLWKTNAAGIANFQVARLGKEATMLREQSEVTTVQELILKQQEIIRWGDFANWALSNASIFYCNNCSKHGTKTGLTLLLLSDGYHVCEECQTCADRDFLLRATKIIKDEIVAVAKKSVQNTIFFAWMKNTTMHCSECYKPKLTVDDLKNGRSVCQTCIQKGRPIEII